MAGDLDDLVVAHLREIHAALHSINAALQQHDRRFDGLDRRLDGVRPPIERTLTLTTISQVSLAKLEASQDAMEAWRRRIGDRLDQIEQRLAKGT